MAKKASSKKTEPTPPPPRTNAGRYKITRQPRTGEVEQPQEPAKPSRYSWRPQDMGND